MHVLSEIGFEVPRSVRMVKHFSSTLNMKWKSMAALLIE